AGLERVIASAGFQDIPRRREFYLAGIPIAKKAAAHEIIATASAHKRIQDFGAVGVKDTEDTAGKIGVVVPGPPYQVGNATTGVFKRVLVRPAEQNSIRFDAVFNRNILWLVAAAKGNDRDVRPIGIET